LTKQKLYEKKKNKKKKKKKEEEEEKKEKKKKKDTPHFRYSSFSFSLYLSFFLLFEIGK
jgi:hypothetical protein